MAVTGRKLHILYLDHTSKWSGGEIALYRTLSAVNRASFALSAVFPTQGELVDRLGTIGVQAQVLPLDARLLAIRKDSLGVSTFRDLSVATAYLRYALRVAQQARQQKVDILHCNSLKSDIYGMIAGRLASKKVVWHVRDYIDPSYLPGKVARIFRRLAQTMPQGVIVNSQSTQQGLFPQGCGRQLCHVVYDGLMESELQSALPTPFSQWRRAVPQIGLLGRIVPWKGQHIFIEAAQQLVQRGVTAEFQIIGAPLFGEEDYEAQIRQQASVSGAKIAFLGFRSDVPNLLRELDILTHCSISPEPFGQVVVEGMAEGLPVIASDGGGVREIIEQGVHGLRTPMGDATALANALEELIRQPEKASTLGRAAHARVREKFTAALSAHGVESFYQELREK